MKESTQLTLNFRPQVRLTDDLFVRLCGANPDLRLERTARGELEIMTPAGSGSGRRNAALTFQLVGWANATGRGLGQCFDSSCGFALPNGAIRSPDASWVAQARWDTLTPEQQESFAPLCPDFIAELRSPTDKVIKLREKMREYRAQGCRLGWLINPKAGTVEVYRPGLPVERLERPTTLSGEDVLPGFVLDLKGILFD
jgi:Uma2 family endonuclease